MKTKILGPGRSVNALEGKRPLTSGWKIPFSFSSGVRRTLSPPPAAAAPLAVSAAHAGTSAACVASLIGCLAASTPAPAPGTISSAASAALGEGGEGSHLLGRTRPPSLPSSSSSSLDGEYSSVPGEESPCCSRSRNSSLLRSRRSRHRMLRSLLRAARSCSRCCAARACARD
jgi:hypothetical protein